MAKQPRVWSGSQWEPLAVTLPDLSNYSTTTQMNTAISNADNEVTISSGSFSAVSSLSISNSLSDTYKFYNLSVYCAGSTGAVDFLLRFREDTTDKTTGYYAGGNYGTYTGSTGSWFHRNNSSSFGLFTMSSAETSSATIRIIRPNATLGIISGLFYDNISEAGAHLSGTTTAMTTFNGITFYPSSGTMTGYYLLTGVKA